MDALVAGDKVQPGPIESCRLTAAFRARARRLQVGYRKMKGDSARASLGFRWSVWIFAAYAFVGGSVTMAGWLAGVPRLTDWVGSGISMFPNAALAAVCAGAALILATFRQCLCGRVCRALGLLVALIGAATLFEHLSKIDLGIDAILVRTDWGGKAAMAPGRIGPPASTAYTLLGVALILIASGRPKARRVVPVLGIAVAMIAALSLMGYVSGADPLFAVARYTGIAMQTASVLLALALAVVSSVPDCEPVRTLQQDSAAGLLARRSLPFIIGLPLVLGCLRIRGQLAGWFDTAMGTSLAALILVGSFSALLWWWVGAVAEYERALRDSERLQRLLAHVSELGAHLPETDELTGTICELVAKELNASRCGYALADVEAGTFTVTKDYCGNLRSLAGVYPISKYVQPETLKEGAVVNDDLATHPRTAAQYESIWAPLNLRATLSVFLRREGQLTAMFWVGHDKPRHWTKGEIEMMRLTADRVWIVIERKTAENALRRERERLSRALKAGQETEEKLHQARRELLVHAAELEATVAERTARLQDMVNELEHVSYAIAHDMRAPLRAMNTFANLLLEETLADSASPQSQHYCRRILTASARLDKLIQDALHYTKVVQQQMPLGPVNLTKLVQDLIETYPNLHPDKADIAIENELPVVLGNDALLTQCFSNLLGNAVKFVAPGVRPRVQVRAEKVNGTSRIWVKDNGIGIPQNAHARLFKMFQKLDAQYEGTGIGLAIVRKVVERMGGKVGVESAAGTGSRFWVELPLATQPHDHDRKARP